MKRREQDGWVKTALRSPPDLHEQLHESARESGRTFNAEIIHRLRSTFEQQASAVMLDNEVAEQLIAALQDYTKK